MERKRIRPRCLCVTYMTCAFVRELVRVTRAQFTGTKAHHDCHESSRRGTSNERLRLRLSGSVRFDCALRIGREVYSLFSGLLDAHTCVRVRRTSEPITMAVEKERLLLLLLLLFFFFYREPAKSLRVQQIRYKVLIR
jgi:hypothetical protein